ncbi:MULTISPECIES: DUF4307 domain-containing protein [unclassified Microbispora]|uniref:DUF4307 domain-containing protein n=1 Tax=unclassified Microbispora TaxID=2614687 RepID=UPI0014763402|nr:MULTISPECIES: DUF4307 domain-containing protein [unclassified Microbispora]
MPTDEAGGQGTRPVLGTPDDFPPRPARPARLVPYVVMALIVAVIAGGWGYVMLRANGNPSVSADVITFDASAPDSAVITFTVHKPADRAATCRIQALDTKHLEVGSREVDIPKGRSDLEFTERLRTSAQATAVHVDYCDLV